MFTCRLAQVVENIWDQCPREEDSPQLKINRNQSEYSNGWLQMFCDFSTHKQHNTRLISNNCLIYNIGVLHKTEQYLQFFHWNSFFHSIPSLTFLYFMYVDKYAFSYICKYVGVCGFRHVWDCIHIQVDHACKGLYVYVHAQLNCKKIICISHQSFHIHPLLPCFRSLFILS